MGDDLTSGRDPLFAPNPRISEADAYRILKYEYEMTGGGAALLLDHLISRRVATLRTYDEIVLRATVRTLRGAA